MENLSDCKKAKCKEVQEMIVQFFDDELDCDQIKELKGHLEDCSHCLEKSNLEAPYKKFIADKMHKKCICEKFAANLRAKILQSQ